MGWPQVPLQVIAVDLQPGFACQPTEGSDGIRQLRTNNVSPEGRIDLSEVKRVPATRTQLERYLLQSGDILFNNTNSPALVGKTAFFGEEGRFLFSNHMTRIRVLAELAEPRYIARCLHWLWSQGAFGAHITQWVNQAAINRSQLASVRIPLPPLSEQHRIVEILDQADRLRCLRAEADAEADRILPALFIEMFRDPGQASKPVRLDEVVEIGGALVDPNKEQYLDLPHIGGENIEKGTGRILNPQLVRESQLRSGKFHFAERHVLYSKIRPYLNKVAFPRMAGLCSADIYPLLPRDQRIGPWFLTSLLRSEKFLAYALSQSDRLRMPKLNQEQLGSYLLGLPEPSDLRGFESRAEGIAVLENKRDASRDAIARLFDMLLAEALSGSLTASWREAHTNELVQETEQQVKALAEARG